MQIQKGVAPPEAVQAAVKRLVADRGEGAAMAKLGMSRQTVARLAGGLNVQRATLSVASDRLGIGGREGGR